LADLLQLFLLYPGFPVTLAWLSVLAYYDLRYREVGLGPLLAPLPAAAVLAYAAHAKGLLSTWAAVASAASSAAPVAAVALLSWRGYMGWGDAVAIAVLSALNPFLVQLGPLAMPASGAAIALGSAYAVAHLVGNALWNARRPGLFAEASRGAGALARAYYFLFARALTPEEAASARFYFPLYGGGYRRAVARAGVEPLEMPPVGGPVLASKGIPFLASLLTGYAALTAVVALYPGACIR